MSTTPFIFLSNREPVDEVMGLGATEWIYGPSMNPNEVIARAVYHMRLHKQQITHGI
jgi:DNA-binding response OmpR family regulator